MRQRTPAQLLRGILSAVVATLLALLFHLMGGGPAPALAGVLVPLLLSSFVCVLLAGRALSLTRISVSVLASQALFHQLFLLGATGTATAAAGTVADPHAHHAASAALLQAVPATAQGDDAGPLMWLSHLVAATLTTTLIYHGERILTALLRLARLIGALLPLPEPPASTPQSRPVAAIACSAPVFARSADLSTAPGRGPPLND
ncbi:hypothetical protein [Sediminivirga luteola]|uniref:Uncharacterized protein n=1 Tax=Sediminivirga luteola TaxID=1774748 RepID=A0A8J2XJW8_9MICO|nr:hypothetical protein [Sediminivirga luteola]GGA04938.1 hypothetical protein GCM10011333_04500 [Sediminivirga luteola]